MMQTVYVNAWAYNTGGGFDWYFKSEDADAAYATELKNVREATDVNWTRFRFDFRTEQTDPEAITREIDLLFAECTIPNEET